MNDLLIKLILLTIITFVVNCLHHTYNSFDINGSITIDKKYESQLYKLGSFPVKKLTEPYWDNHHHGKVYSKGQRIDVFGWLPPDVVYQYLTEEEMLKYGLPKKPLSYNEYISFFDIPEYEKTKNPVLIALFIFTLDELKNKSIDIKDPADIINIYEADIGLEENALEVLTECFSYSDWMKFYKKYKDPLIVDFLPVPVNKNDEYSNFMYSFLSVNSIDTMQHFFLLKKLYSSDNERFSSEYKNFIIKNINGRSNNWIDRLYFVYAMVDIQDADLIKMINDLLLNDPSTNIRERLLYLIQEKGAYSDYFETAFLLAKGEGKPHSITAISSNSSCLNWQLIEYFEWVKSITDDDIIKRRSDIALKYLNNYNPYMRKKRVNSKVSPFTEIVKEEE